MGVEMRAPAQGAATPKLTEEELQRLRASLPDPATADRLERGPTELL